MNRHPSISAHTSALRHARLVQVRLDNVGLINGGVGVRMSSAAREPAGFYPGRPLFLLANDLEVDYTSGNAIELLGGEEVQLSNAYVQVRL